MFAPRLFLTSLAFTIIVASEVTNEAGQVDPSHEAPPTQDEAPARPVHADAKAIEDEDAESTTAIGIALHGSDVAQKPLEQPQTLTKSAAEMAAQPSAEILGEKLDQSHKASAAQDEAHAKPAHADAKAIEDEDQESTTAIDVAIHGSEVAEKKSEQLQTMIVQPSGEVLGSKLDQVPETPLQSKQRVAAKARRVAGDADGMNHHSLHAAASPVLRMDVTPSASPDVANGGYASPDVVNSAIAGGTAQEVIDSLHDPDLPVLRTHMTPPASPVAASRAQWSYNTQQNKWVKAAQDGSAVEVKEVHSSSAHQIPAQLSNISNIGTTFNFYLQRNLSRWKRIFAEADVISIIHISIIISAIILAVRLVVCDDFCKDSSVLDKSPRAKEKQSPNGDVPKPRAPLKNDDLLNKGHTGMPANPEAPQKNDDVISARKYPEAPPKVRDLRAMLLKKMEVDATRFHEEVRDFTASPGETCSNVQVKHIHHVP